MPSVEFTLRDDEVERLRKPAIGSGGFQVLLHRLLRVSVGDFATIVRYWCCGRGGFQRRLPIATLAPYLQTAAPLFGASAAQCRAQRWIYVVQDSEHRVKIGGTFNPRRRGGGFRTDNADPLTLLLWLPEGGDITERGLQARFAHLRIRGNQEWFWFGEDIKTFIAERRASAAA
jgi:hypothetical protein